MLFLKHFWLPHIIVVYGAKVEVLNQNTQDG